MGGLATIPPGGSQTSCWEVFPGEQQKSAGKMGSKNSGVQPTFLKEGEIVNRTQENALSRGKKILEEADTEEETGH